MSAYKLRCHKCDDVDYPGYSELIDHLRAEHDDLFDITDEYYDTPLDAVSQLMGADVFSDALLFSANAEIERLNRMLRLAVGDAWVSNGWNRVDAEEDPGFAGEIDALRARAQKP